MLEINKESFILVASDAHDDEIAFGKLAQIAQMSNCVSFIYAGDLNIENFFINEILRYRNFVFLPVAGNCDMRWAWTDIGMDLPPFRTVTTKNLKIFVAHGDRYLLPGSVGLIDSEFDLVITGHTHQHGISRELITGKQITFLNPGSPSRPRGNSRKSYALVVFSENTSVRLQIRALDGDALLSEETIPVHNSPVGND